MATPSQNPLLSSHQTPDVQVVLHPLVLLTISDYITRHSLRELPGPIVGGLLGQHNGREITIEHAFECATLPGVDPSRENMIPPDRFAARLEQFKTVHKDRKLDLVGWYTLLPKSGPTPDILPTHAYLLSINESSLLLAFHPDEVSNHSVGAKLPLSIYESNYEKSSEEDKDGEDKTMEDGESSSKLKFLELPYTVEAEAEEMISMDFVARGGGNATAVEMADARSSSKGATSAAAATDASGKATKKTKIDAQAAQEESQEATRPAEVLLSREEEEMMVALTAKANAIKMLNSRINVIAKYLEQLPHTDPSSDSTEMTDADSHVVPSHAILRQIQALVSRLELLVPSDAAAFQEEILREQNDVNMVSLLNDMVGNTVAARGVFKKFQIVEMAKRMDKGAAARDMMGVDYLDRRFADTPDSFM